MIIKCQNNECGFDINIPDDRLPDKAVNITCPKCKGQSLFQPQKGEAPKSEVDTGRNANKALICDDSETNRAQIKDALAKLGFGSDEVSTVEEAIKIIKKPDLEYDMIIIDKVFPEDDEGGYKILNEITILPHNIRRKCFVAFVSAQMRTNDASAAFLMGANTVINKKDLPHLPQILKEELYHYNNLYRVFNACLQSRKGSRYIQH